MKKIFLFPVVILALTHFLSFVNISFSPLTYTESSSGLQTINLDGGRTEIEMADINADGNIDFLSVGDHGNPNVNTTEHGVMIWFGNGSGSNWNLIQNGNFGYGGIAIGDLNRDNKPDIGYGIHHNYSSSDFGDQLIETALNDGTGLNWTPWDDSLGTQGETYGMFTTDFGDVNNDSLLDIGVVSFGCCNGLRIYKNLGVGKWRSTFTVTGGNTQMDFVFGDMNNDGNLDFAVAHNAGTPYFGDGTGNFVLMHNNLPAPGNLGLKGISLGDVNNDGSKDLALINSSNQIQIFKWNEAAQGWDNLFTSSSGSFTATALADMNADGFIDLIAFASGVITIWTGDGGSNWTQNISFTSHSSPGTYSDFTIGDADRNGYPDIVIEASEGTRNKIKFFQEATPFSALSVKPLFPKGGERFKHNSVQFIDWLSSAPQAQTSKINLEFSSAGNSGPWTLIKDSLPNNGRYQWIVPPNVNSANCFIRYTLFVIGGSSVTAMNQNPFVIGTIVGVNNNNNEIPEKFSLEQNYPNPFNPKTIIRYSLLVAGMTILKIFDALGREIETLLNENLKAGTYEIEFDGSNFGSGVYYYKLVAGDYRETKKMVLVK